jgi:hypothetical protein
MSNLTRALFLSVLAFGVDTGTFAQSLRDPLPLEVAVTNALVPDSAAPAALLTDAGRQTFGVRLACEHGRGQDPQSASCPIELSVGIDRWRTSRS